MRNHRLLATMKRQWACFFLALCLTVGLAGCASAPGPQTEQVVVADLDTSDASTVSQMTREELEEHVRRFADRYLTRVAIAVREVIEAYDTVEATRFMEDWRNVSYAAIVELAIGPDAVTNLMDMMVLTMLSRMVVEDYWAQRIPDETARNNFIDAYRDLEADIWGIADDVLTEEHQRNLAELVIEWRTENPEVVFPWYVRLSNFSGQRAASLNAVKQSGGMLAEVARAREAAEELQSFGERVLFYLQRAPMITSGQFEASANDVISGPEVTQLVANLERFVDNMERITILAESLPDSRLAAIDQFMEELGQERTAMMQELTGASPQLQSVLSQLLPVLESIERTVAMARAESADEEPFDINEYRLLVNESAVTAAELRLLVQSIEQLVSGVGDASELTDVLLEVETEVLDRFFLRMVGFLVLFFVLLLVSRFVWVRMSTT
jgi:hypothetical protein